MTPASVGSRTSFWSAMCNVQAGGLGETLGRDPQSVHGGCFTAAALVTFSSCDKRA